MSCLPTKSRCRFLILHEVQPPGLCWKVPSRPCAEAQTTSYDSLCLFHATMTTFKYLFGLDSCGFIVPWRKLDLQPRWYVFNEHHSIVPLPPNLSIIFCLFNSVCESNFQSEAGQTVTVKEFTPTQIMSRHSPFPYIQSPNWVFGYWGNSSGQCQLTISGKGKW